MIDSKQKFLYYLDMDRLALGINRKSPRFFGDEIWKYEIELRKGEYLLNCKPFFGNLDYYTQNLKYII